ncbi:DUF305 domain-containing protein [Aquipuribacter sp. SD81]|uniref:DUF305 domain-containing protein n=1 Tax=Aquipuribacter sp. SD81 TaxID=3127703 RepID=UPI003017B1CB
MGAALLVVVGLLGGVALAGPAAAAAPAEDSVEAGFARDMSVHHGQAVEMSVLVRDRSDADDLRQVALDIVLTQQNQQGQMLGWLTTWGLAPASTVPVMAWMGDEPFSGSMSGMDMAGHSEDDGEGGEGGGNPMLAMGMASSDEMQALADADGVEAERIWAQLMIEHHLGGIAMAEEAAERAEEPQVRRLAEGMVAGQTAELTTLQRFLDERGGPVDLAAG